MYCTLPVHLAVAFRARGIIRSRYLSTVAAAVAFLQQRSGPFAQYELDALHFLLRAFEVGSRRSDAALIAVENRNLNADSDPCSPMVRFVLASSSRFCWRPPRSCRLGTGSRLARASEACAFIVPIVPSSLPDSLRESHASTDQDCLRACPPRFPTRGVSGISGLPTVAANSRQRRIWFCSAATTDNRPAPPRLLPLRMSGWSAWPTLPNWREVSIALRLILRACASGPPFLVRPAPGSTTFARYW